jgi:hypothetical protein
MAALPGCFQDCNFIFIPKDFSDVSFCEVVKNCADGTILLIRSENNITCYSCFNVNPKELIKT